MNLKGSKAIVTGVSSGLGRAIAQKLVQKEAIVYGMARTVKN